MAPAEVGTIGATAVVGHLDGHPLLVDPDPDVRNGQRARECATRACELTEWAEAGFLDTLATACAECGEFDDAIKWQEKAMEKLPADDADKQADYQSRLELYEQRKPARVSGASQP